ncbi:MAG: DDE-type integrase/transposase/recombinase [Pseudomonadota bacterium]
MMTKMTTIKEKEKRLKEIYYNPNHPAGLGSVRALAVAAKVPLKRTREWLRKQPTYTLHRRALKRYKTRKYYVNNIDDQWQMDLADMVQVQRHNNGYRFILTCIDILSRFAWARPLKTKTGREVAAAIEDIFKSNNRIPKRVQTDQGNEFYNVSVKRLFEANNVELFSVKSPFKSAMVERLNRTLKTKLWKYFTSRNTYKWLEVLPKIVHSYNHSKHRIIKMNPADVNKENAMLVWERLYGKDSRNKNTVKDVTVGDRVRISKIKGQFEKGYLPNWSREEFFVDEINKKFLPTMLTLKDHHGEKIEGNFYEDEIQRIQRDDDVYEVEKIIQQRRRNGELWYFVKWLGYDDSFNSWVRQRDIMDVYDNNTNASQ